MIDELTVINLNRNSLLNSSVRSSNHDVFVLKTCQRTLILGYQKLPLYHLEYHKNIQNCSHQEESDYQIHHGSQAYIFLLETICGLKSEVLAESEVVNQFKEAFREYKNLPRRNNQILTLLQRLFQDSKKIRTDHLLEIGQLSYAGIARKLVHQKNQGNDVLVVGSGTLAEDLIKLLKKRHRVFLTARNQQRVNQLCQNYTIQEIPWKNYHLYKNFTSIINSIGCEEILFDTNFFHSFAPLNDSDSKLFIDLGSPSVIQTHLKETEGVFRLEDIFKQSAKMNTEKMEKIKCAKDSILRICESRRQSFSLNHSFEWEELQLA